MDPIAQQLKNSKNVLLATHTNPDGDAIGSLIALRLCLDAMNKQSTLYNESPIPAVYRFLPSVNEVVKSIDKTASYDTAVVLDCGDLDRIGKEAETVCRLPVIINIDHHSTNKRFGHLQRVDTDACATAEIIYHMIKGIGVPITKPIATAIYTGILTDTGSFRFSNTNRSAFFICEKMVACGVNPYHIAQHVYGTYSLGRIKLLNLALDTIEISKNNKLSMMTLTQEMFDETGTQPHDADGLINYAKGIEGVKIAVLIQEHTDGKMSARTSNQYHVSLRSDGTVDVGTIAASFGGGGHFSAAGFNIDSTLSDLKDRIYALSEKF
jgi:phosphoesterase RecJ-like protein